MPRTALYSAGPFPATISAVQMEPVDFVPPAGFEAVASDVANVGDSYDGSTFTPPQPPPPSVDDLVVYAKRAQQNVLSVGVTVNVAASGSPAINVLCDGTNATRADLGLLAQFGQLNPASTKQWLDNNGVVTSLTGAQYVTLAELVGNWIADTYPALVDLLSRITASSPTITRKAQIDAYVWPTT